MMLKTRSTWPSSNMICQYHISPGPRLACSITSVTPLMPTRWTMAEPLRCGSWNSTASTVRKTCGAAWAPAGTWMGWFMGLYFLYFAGGHLAAALVLENRVFDPVALLQLTQAALFESAGMDEYVLIVFVVRGAKAITFG